jgi:hypothetical protein
MTDEPDDSTTEESEPQTAPDDAEPDPDHETSAEVGADDEPTEPE